MSKIYGLIVCVFLVFSGVAQAQNNVVSGTRITENTVWSGTVVIEGDVTVVSSARLDITPGTKILFSPNKDKFRSGSDKTRCELIIEGILMAKGDISNKITFSSNSSEPRMGDWYGITILNPKQVSIIEYSVIEYAYNGITVKKSDPQIRNSQIRFNFNAGISAEVKAAPKIYKNILTENGYAGLICNLGARPILSENLITLNQIGVVIFSLSQPNLGSVQKDSDYNLGQNRIFENTEYEVYNHSNLPIKAENNSWGTFTGRNELAVKLYDNNNESKFGPIDVDPFLGANKNLQEFLLLSQNTNQTEEKVEPPKTQPAAESVKTEKPSAPVTIPRDVAIKDIANQVKQEDISDSGVKDVQNTKTESETASLAVAPEKLTPTAPVQEKANVPSINYDQVFLEPFLDNKKIALKTYAPQISNKSLGMGANGKVIVRVVVGKNGFVESAQVLKGLNAYYDKLSIEAAEKFTFKSGTVNGKKVRFSTNLFFEFK
ncbi:MAG: TonB family protein [Calditrichaceae bacterium]